jgi:intraflagellar transport protein 46
MVLDEPATIQSDPAVLDLRLRAAAKGLSKGSTSNQQVRSISLATGQLGQKALSQWVQNIHDLHVHKPPDRVEYSKRMPDVENLMQEWPAAVDVALSTNSVYVWRLIWFRLNFLPPISI